MTKYYEITDAFGAAEYFTELSKQQNMNSVYRVMESIKEYCIISNVPHEIYTHPKLKKYTPPKSHNTGNNEYFISFLHDAFNFFHHNYPDAHLRYDDGKLFHYNNCYDNAMGVYFCLQNIAANNGMPLKSPICISLGYISNLLTKGGLIGNAVVKTEGLIVHDWHIWNMVNNFIIDLSIQKNGGIHDISITEIQWQRAENHVFKYPPANINYAGINFSDHEQFINLIKDIFDNIK